MGRWSKRENKTANQAIQPIAALRLIFSLHLSLFSPAGDLGPGIPEGDDPVEDGFAGPGILQIRAEITEPLELIARSRRRIL